MKYTKKHQQDKTYGAAPPHVDGPDDVNPVRRAMERLPVWTLDPRRRDTRQRPGQARHKLGLEQEQKPPVGKPTSCDRH